MPRPPLILHVGTHKTGTTAIQAMLAGLRTGLAARGIAYPDLSPATGGTGQDHNALAHLFIETGPLARLRLWRSGRLLRRRARGAETVVLSAEAIVRHNLPQHHPVDAEDWFSSHAAYLRRLAGSLHGFDLRPLIYFRRPEDAAVSLYKEALVRGRVAACRPMGEFLAPMLPRFDYPRQIAVLTECLGPTDAVGYEAEARRGLLPGFLDRIGATGLPLPARGSARPSPGNRATVWLQRALPAVPAAEFRHRILFALDGAGRPWFEEAAPSTLWSSRAEFDAFLVHARRAYDLPYIGAAPSWPDLPPPAWSEADHAAAEAGFADWRQQNAARLADRDRRRLKHYDPDPVDPAG